MIQITPPVTPGSGGSPVLDESGNVNRALPCLLFDRAFCIVQVCRYRNGRPRQLRSLRSQTSIKSARGAIPSWRSGWPPVQVVTDTDLSKILPSSLNRRKFWDHGNNAASSQKICCNLAEIAVGKPHAEERSGGKIRWLFPVVKNLEGAGLSAPWHTLTVASLTMSVSASAAARDRRPPGSHLHTFLVGRNSDSSARVAAPIIPASLPSVAGTISRFSQNVFSVRSRIVFSIF
jgi:hypothetical protein